MSKRTKLVKLLFFISVGMLFITGCVGTAPQPSVSPNVKYKKKETFKIDIKKDMNVYEKQLVEIAKKAEYKYNQYVELLRTMKKKKEIEDLAMKYHILTPEKAKELAGVKVSGDYLKGVSDGLKIALGFHSRLTNVLEKISIEEL